MRLSSCSRKLVISLTIFFSPLPAFAQTQTRDGAIFGGLAGAVLGGVVGNQKHDATEGALIGGAVGAVTGGLIGNHQQQQAEQRYYQQQQWQRQNYYHSGYVQPGYVVQHHHPVYVQTQPVYTPTPVYVQPQPVYVTQAPATPIRRGVTVADILNLTKNNVSETVIANHIESSGVAYQVSIDDVVTMSDAGVSDLVITTMQNAPIVNSNGTSTPRATPVASAPTQSSDTGSTTQVMTMTPSTSTVRRVATKPPALKPIPANRGKF